MSCILDVSYGNKRWFARLNNSHTINIIPYVQLYANVRHWRKCIRYSKRHSTITILDTSTDGCKGTKGRKVRNERHFWMVIMPRWSVILTAKHDSYRIYINELYIVMCMTYFSWYLPVDEVSSGEYSSSNDGLNKTRTILNIGLDEQKVVLCGSYIPESREQM